MSEDTARNQHPPSTSPPKQGPRFQCLHSAKQYTNSSRQLWLDKTRPDPKPILFHYSGVLADQPNPDEQASWKIIADSFFRALSNEPPPAPKLDWRSLGKSIEAITSAADDDILTQSEADALLHFILTKFVERKVGATLKDLGTTLHRFDATQEGGITFFSRTVGDT